MQELSESEKQKAEDVTKEDMFIAIAIQKNEIAIQKNAIAIQEEMISKQEFIIGQLDAIIRKQTKEIQELKR